MVGMGRDLSPTLRHIPRFWHLVDDDMQMGNSGAEKQTSETTSVLTKLTELKDDGEALLCLKTAFCNKLGQVLQIPVESLDSSAPLTALGVDSLIAVEVRSWFLKTLGLEIPVLKLLSGTSLADISRDAVRKLRSERGAPSTDESQMHSSEQGQTTGSAAQIRVREPDAVKKASESQTEASSSTVVTSSQASGRSETPDVVSSGSSSSAFLDDSLSAVPEAGSYLRVGPMSYAQARLYFLHTYLEDKSTYNVGYFGKYHGHVDIARLKRALDVVCMRHESLRSSYLIIESTNEAVQAVNQHARVDLEHRNVSNEDEVQQVLEDLKGSVFDIENGLLLKVVVLSRQGSPAYIAFLHHHIAMDGVAWRLFVKDLDQAYKEMPDEPHQPVTQAIDICSAQRLAYTGERLRKPLGFWKELYQSPLLPLPLFPFSKCKERRLLNRYDTETVQFELSSELAKRIKHVASSLHITPFHFHLTTLAFVLGRCLGVEDLGVGIVDANRHDPGSADSIGYFLNMLPLRLRIGDDAEFGPTSRRVRDNVLAALENAAVPFDMILDQLRIPRSGSHHPLFQVMLNYRSGYSSMSPLGEGSIEWDGGITARNPYDIAIDITEMSQRTILHLTTQRYLYSASDTELLMRWYVRALEGLVQNPSTRVSDCPVSNNDDLLHAQSLGQGERLSINRNSKTLVARIDEMAGQFPDSVAVKDGYGHSVTYAQMRARSFEIAHHLLDSVPGIAPGAYVAMILHPSVDHVCCMLATLRLGLVWVPLDLQNPHERLSAIVGDCHPQALICNEATAVHVNGLIRRNALITTTTVVNIEAPCPENRPEREVNDASRPDQPAIILYTSGSTGVPKGVILSHSNIISHVYTNTQLYALGRETVLQQSSLGFDLSLDQTFHALANGGTLVIVSSERRGDPVHIAQTMLDENVTYTMFVTSEYLSLLNYGTSSLLKCHRWRFAFCLGEKLTPQLRRAFGGLGLAGVRLINAYGPTEATIACARGVVPYQTSEDVASQSDNLVVMPNYGVVVVDDQLRPLPLGLPGEICIYGDGLALGYLNRPNETEQSFIERDLEAQRTLPTRLYRTGDTGRLLQNGTLDIIGRIKGDKQVKIRGHRVELDEVATVLAQKAQNIIANATASYRAESDILVAFVVFRADFAGSRVAYTEYLKTDLPLPRYMRPDYIIPVDDIPKNVNGKEDRRAIDELPIPRLSSRVESENGPSSLLSPAEVRMKKVWEDVLAERMAAGVEYKVSPDSDFFNLGGNSLLAIKLRSVLNREFGVVLSLPDIFQSSTLREMAGRATQDQEDGESIPRPEVIDWDQELSSLLEGFPPPPTDVQRPPTSNEPGLNVLLTGATGFLGTQILQRLVADDRVRQIHCVAIRPLPADGPGAPRGRHVACSSEKVFEYPGDLTAPLLGLSATQFRHLGDSAHLIIHNGAEVSYLKTYRSLRGANVASTRVLCEMAVARGAPLHFISTAGVAGVIAEEASTATGATPAALGEVSVAGRAPVSSGAGDGYLLSKWASEALLERVSASHGLPVWIHRPSNIVGDGAPESDLVPALIRYSQDLKAVPTLASENIVGAIDLVSIQDVSARVVKAALDSAKRVPEEHCGEPVPRFIHHCGATKIAPDGLGRYLEGLDGTRYKELPVRDWLDRAHEAGLGRPQYDFLTEAFDSGRQMVFPALEKSG